jgi:hypothetical protein
MTRPSGSAVRPISPATGPLRDGSVVADLVRIRLRQGGTVRLRGTGFSMFPLVPPRSSVTIGHATAGDLKPGDIVAFESFRGIACHLFAGLGPDGTVRTRGIASGPDRAFGPERLVGRVLRVHLGPASLETDSRLFRLLLGIVERGGALPGRVAARIWSSVRSRRLRR